MKKEKQSEEKMYLDRFISKHFSLKKSRQKTLIGIIKGLLLNRGVHYKQMAEMIKGKSKLDSKIKRIYRFLTEDNLKDENFTSAIKSLIPEGKLVIVIDRTNWQYGNTKRNICALGVCVGGISMPILFETLSHKGASSASVQIKLTEKFINEYGKERIKAILGDREFDSEQFINYLHSKNIAFCIRIRKHNIIQDSEIKYVKIKNYLKQENNLKTKLYGVPITLGHIALEKGGFLTLAASNNISNPIELYSARWDIETTFKGCKTNAFRIEDTRIISIKRIHNLVKCLFLAFAIALKIGLIKHSMNPIPIKTTLKSKIASFLQYGLSFIKQSFSYSHSSFASLFSLLTLPYSLPPPFFVQ